MKSPNPRYRIASYIVLGVAQFSKMKNQKQITAYLYIVMTPLHYILSVTDPIQFHTCTGSSIFMSFRLGRASRGSYAGKLGRRVITVIKSTNGVARILGLKICSKRNVERWPLGYSKILLI